MSLDSTVIVRAHLAAGALPLSRSVSQLQTMLQGADYNAADLAEHMRTDPTLTARVMAVANSTFFSRQPCDAIGDAVNRLGSAQLSRIFAQVLARASLLTPLGAYGLPADGMWRRAVFAAIGAELAAARLREDRSSAYMVGLMHQIGMLVVNRLWTTKGETKRLVATDFEHEYSVDEKARYRFDHAEFGAEMLRQLSFPESVCRVVDHQYGDALDPVSRALYVGRLARSICCDLVMPNPNLEIMEIFDLGSRSQLDTFIEDVRQEAQNRIQGG